jgi:hypothetical protein
MRIALALVLATGCVAGVPKQQNVLPVGALTPAPPSPPAATDEPRPAVSAPISAEQLADRCQVVAIEGEDGEPRADLARVECEPPQGTPGPDCLAGAIYAAAVAGVARDRIWFVYRISPAEQVPAGQFRVAVLYLEGVEDYERARTANLDPAYVYTTATEVMPAEAFLMQKSHRENKPALAKASGTESRPADNRPSSSSPAKAVDPFDAYDEKFGD